MTFLSKLLCPLQLHRTLPRFLGLFVSLLLVCTAKAQPRGACLESGLEHSPNSAQPRIGDGAHQLERCVVAHDPDSLGSWVVDGGFSVHASNPGRLDGEWGEPREGVTPPVWTPKDTDGNTHSAPLRFFIAAPAHGVTGGPEALHQLCGRLREAGREAAMLYLGDHTLLGRLNAAVSLLGPACALPLFRAAVRGDAAVPPQYAYAGCPVAKVSVGPCCPWPRP